MQGPRDQLRGRRPDGGDFTRTDLEGAKFVDTDLTGANLSTAEHYQINPDDNVLRATRYSTEAALALASRMGVIVGSGSSTIMAVAAVVPTPYGFHAAHRAVGQTRAV